MSVLSIMSVSSIVECDFNRGIATLSDRLNLLRRLFQAFYKHIYNGKQGRLQVWWPTVISLLDVTANIHSCGPAWSYWQLPGERLLGTLSRLIQSRRFPYAALTNAVSSKYSAELGTRFSESHVANTRENATGKPVRHKSQDPDGTMSVSKDPK